MERRRRLELHIRARSAQPAFQIKSDGMSVCACVCVRQKNRNQRTNQIAISSKTEAALMMLTRSDVSGELSRRDACMQQQYKTSAGLCHTLQRAQCTERIILGCRLP